MIHGVYNHVHIKYPAKGPEVSSNQMRIKMYLFNVPGYFVFYFILAFDQPDEILSLW